MDDDIELQAFEWRDRLKRDPSDATRGAFDAWRSADLRHAAAFEQQSRLASVAVGSRWRGVMPDKDRARRKSWVSGGIAAGAAVALAATVLVFVAPVGRNAVPPSLVASSSGRDVRHAVRLADGSLVVLAAGGAVMPAEMGSPRSVRLTRGAARFIVVHDPFHPFIVAADGLVITARGTVFDVALSGGSARVGLIEGRVDVVGRDTGGLQHPVVLRPGEVLAPGAQHAQLVPIEESAPPIGWLEIDGMTLGDVVAIASRGNGARIMISDPTLATLQITGRFNMADSRALATKLAAALDLRVIDRGQAIILSRP